MMDENPKPAFHAPCKDIQRLKPVHEVNDELSEEISKDYRTFPCFEKTLLEHLYINHYSLTRNELLKCRWEQFRKNIAGKVTQPMQFPSNSDVHFYKGNVKYIPSQSIHRMTDFRMQLKPGPGVDWRGQMPIPNELFLKRVVETTEKVNTGTKTKAKVKTAGKKVEKKVPK